MQKIIIEPAIEGGRFDKFLNRHLPNAGSSFIYKMLRKKNITLNGKKADGKEIIKAGDSVEMFFSEDTYNKFRGVSAESVNITEYEKAYKELDDISVIFENTDVLIMNKPVGVLSQKAKDSDLSANEWLIGYLLNRKEVSNESLKEFKPSVCNRLDRNTSGILLCGKSLKGSRGLSRIIKNREIGKFYNLLVVGTDIKEQILTGFLSKDSKNNKVSVALNDDEQIKTGIKPIKSNEKITLLEAELFTGKTHQIRAHLASISHPLIGDYKYGKESVNDYFKKEYGLESQFLSCVRVTFPNECDALPDLAGKTFEAELPALFKRILEGEGL